MPHFICPNCGTRSVSGERTAGFEDRGKSCSHCGFSFLFELLDDYYPSPNAAFFVCDHEARVISAGRGVRELTGLGDDDVIGQPIREVLGLRFQNGDDHIKTALEWGVRVLDKPATVTAVGEHPEHATADIFPAYDDDVSGVLIVVTPHESQPA